MLLADVMAKSPGGAVHNLRLSPEQREIRATVRDFVEREIKPAALPCRRSRRSPACGSAA